MPTRGSSAGGPSTCHPALTDTPSRPTPYLSLSASRGERRAWPWRRFGVSERRSVMETAFHLSRRAHAQAPQAETAPAVGRPFQSRARRAADQRSEAACDRLPGLVATSEDYDDLSDRRVYHSRRL